MLLTSSPLLTTVYLDIKYIDWLMASYVIHLSDINIFLLFYYFFLILFVCKHIH